MFICRYMDATLFGGGPGQGKLPKPSQQMALEKTFRIKAQSCPMLRLWYVINGGGHNTSWG